MLKEKGPRKEIALNDGHPLFLFHALFKALRILVFGLFLYYCLSLWLKREKDDSFFVSDNNQTPKNFGKCQNGRDDEEILRMRRKKRDEKEKREKQYTTLEAGVDDLVTHEIKHIVELGKNLMLFQFPNETGVFDVGFLLTPYYANANLRRWQSFDCDESLVVLQLRMGNMIDSPVIFEHILKNGEITPIKWKNLITYPSYNVQIFFIPKTEKGKLAQERTRLGYHETCGQVLVHGSFGFIYKGDRQSLMKLYRPRE